MGKATRRNIATTLLLGSIASGVLAGAFSPRVAGGTDSDWEVVWMGLLALALLGLVAGLWLGLRNADVPE